MNGGTSYQHGNCHVVRALSVALLLDVVVLAATGLILLRWYQPTSAQPSTWASIAAELHRFAVVLAIAIVVAQAIACASHRLFAQHRRPTATDISVVVIIVMIVIGSLSGPWLAWEALDGAIGIASDTRGFGAALTGDLTTVTVAGKRLTSDALVVLLFVHSALTSVGIVAAVRLAQRPLHRDDSHQRTAPATQLTSRVPA